MNETKRLDLNFKEFTANGKKYLKNTVFSIKRFEAFEIWQPQLAYDLDFQAFYSQDVKLFDMINKQKFADCAVLIHNRLSKIKDLLDKKRTHPALLLCALAIVREDEDPGELDEALQLEKIEDWRKEGFAMSDFFLFAASIMEGLPNAYNEYKLQELNEEKITLTK